MRNPIKVINAHVNYFRSKRKADELHRQSGERIYVLGTANGNIVIGDKQNVRFQNFLMRKARGTLKTERNITVAQMEYACFYCTPYKDGVKGKLNNYKLYQKKEEFIEYMLNRKKITDNDNRDSV